ncbi:MAG: STM3941 family protein [Planctomycetales bacterium]
MECSTSIVRTAGVLVLCLLMIGGAYVLTTLDRVIPQIVGWLGIAFFGLCLPAWVIQIFRNGPAVVLDQEGIHIARPPFGTILWDDIESVGTGSVESTRFLCVEVADPEAYLARLRPWQRSFQAANRKLGFSEISVSFAGLSPGLDEAWRYIAEHYPEKIATQ